MSGGGAAHPGGDKRGDFTPWYAPPNFWNRRQDTGRSVADAFAEYGIPLVRAQNNRVQGWLNLRNGQAHFG